MFSLTDKTAFVTGAGSGIGAATARTLARAGARVFAADLDSASAETVAAEIRSAGGIAEMVHLDVTDFGACQRVASELHARFPAGLDVLVNNAGIGCVGTILQTGPEDLDRLYAVNVRGVFHLSKVFLPPMIARRGGSIVNLASVAGIVAVRDRVAYCATKFAVVGLTKAMALDHAADNVRINCICPGRVETPFVQARIREYPDPGKAFMEMCASQPLGRMARPEEIAAAALYLASDEASFVTGSAFAIDGGLSAGK
jgi:2-keto-3-deoxy-L-fuconate dehydrogenase